MANSDSGAWVPPLNPKQLGVFNDYHRFILCSGPRKSGKTVGVLFRLIRHGWETPGGRIGVISVTIKNAKIGIWDSLYKVAELWEQNIEGFKITKTPSIDGATRMHYFRISNQHGGESEFQLHSLDNENEIEAKMKATEFSCIFVSELTNFRSDKVFRFTVPQLRMLHLKRHQYLWIADTNPCPEDGDQFWAYKIWYEERIQDDHPRPGYQAQISLHEFKIADNTFLQKEDIEELEGAYASDPDLFDVYINGRWLATSRDSMFVNHFKPSTHIIGGDEEMVPEPDSTSLIVGWDPGDANHSATLLEKVSRGNSIFWKCLDEVVVIGGDVSLEDFSLSVLEMMEDVEKQMDKKYDWIHWSDISAVERFRSSSGTWDQMVIYQATGGKIRIEGVPKFSGSQRLRVQLVKQLLGEGRLYINERCEGIIGALRGGLKKGKNRATYLRDNKHKHPFDSFTYPVLAESSYELQLADGPEVVSSGFSTRL